jgi:UDP-glucose:(heptosyl)LPS alpha-1,3-glucosyltransferase
VTTVDSHVDVRLYYGAADVFVLPSIYDPAPDYALEAMACALPVVSSTKSGVAELLAEHDCGFVFPSHDVGKLAAHMRALHDPAMRARLGENARAAVLPFSPAATTLALVLLYRDLLATTVPGAAPRSAPTGATGL